MMARGGCCRRGMDSSRSKATAPATVAARLIRSSGRPRARFYQTAQEVRAGEAAVARQHQRSVVTASRPPAPAPQQQLADGPEPHALRHAAGSSRSCAHAVHISAAQ